MRSCGVCAAATRAVILHVASGTRYEVCGSDRCQEIMNWRSWGIVYCKLPKVGQMEAEDAQAATVD